ncbi:MAG: magnesium transporter [Clostridiales bacterium]|nr:magnesium transporter [Clostridiales bacterium]
MQEISTKLNEALELIHEKKFSSLRALLSTMEPADLAELLSSLPSEQLPLMFRFLPKELAADTFVEMDSELQQQLISAFSDNELTSLIEDIYLDDAADIVDEMPANVAQRILARASAATRAEINEILKYPKNSAGSIMTTEYVRLRPTMTVAEAFDIIRRTGIDKETVYTCYVTDDKRKLIGVVSALTLLTSEKTALIGDIMSTRVISVKTTDDKEFVAHQLEKYDFLALPVVDSEDRIIGIVTVDDAVDVIIDEYSEDLSIMSAVTPTDKPYLKQSVMRIWIDRIPWLLLLMISATFTGIIITSFENALAAQVALTAFIPMLMDTGGNSGSQASVSVIRGISLRELEFSNLFQVMWKEFRVSILCGITLSITAFIKIQLVDNLIMKNNISLGVSATVCSTLVLTVVFAKFIGSVLPLCAKKLGFDPAVMASPLVTTILDAVVLLVYFMFATVFLKI